LRILLPTSARPHHLPRSICGAFAADGANLFRPGPAFAFFLAQSPLVLLEDWILGHKAVKSACAAALVRFGSPDRGGPAPRQSKPAPALGLAAVLLVVRLVRILLLGALLATVSEFTFWHSIEACNVEPRAVREIFAAVDAFTGGCKWAVGAAAAALGRG
jgi:hypothetical protein